MAIAFDSAADDNAESAAVTISWTHTTGATADFIAAAFHGFDATDADRAFSAASFNGDAMTLANTYNDDTANMTSHIIYRVAPDIGTFLVSLSFAATVNAVWGWSCSLVGVDQSTPIGAVNGKTETDTQNISIALTTTAENSWLLDDFIATQATSGTEPTSSQTTRADFYSIRKHGGSTKVATSIAEYTMAWDTLNTTADSVHNVVEILAAVAPGGTTWPGYISPFGYR